MDRQPVRSRSADCSQPRNPWRARKGSGSSICSSRKALANCRCSPPIPRAPRIERAMMASPKKVTARITPANMVATTNTTPTKASATPMHRKANSDQARPVKGS